MNLDEMIKVGMADLQLCKSPGVLTTLGLGSCVGVALYDPVNKIGGLLHCMLPDSTQFKNNSNTAKYADTVFCCWIIPNSVGLIIIFFSVSVYSGALFISAPSFLNWQ